MENEKTLPTVIKQELGLVEWNYDDVKEELASFLVKYDGYKVTEDTLTGDKKTRAELNKVSKSIDDFRKNVKKELSKPIDFFEDQCKELTGMVSDVSTKIDKSVKEFELIKKEEKKKFAEEIILEISGASKLPQDYTSRIELKESFCNLSSTKSQVEEDINNQIQALFVEYNTYLEQVKIIESAIENANKNLTLKLDTVDYVEKLKYKSVSDVIEDINKKTEKTEVAEKEIKKEIPVIEETDEDEKSINVTITTTATKFAVLKEFMQKNNIKIVKLK